MTELSNTRPKT